MSILLNDNLNISAPLPVDSRYGPYASTSAALAAISSARRYKGLVVAILSGGSAVEYWFKDGTTDSDLILKTAGALTTDQSSQFISSSLLGAANGVAQLDANQKLVTSQIPTITTANLGCLTTGAVAGLVPQLDNLGHITVDQLPPSILGALIFRGLWDASTNTTTNSQSPSLTSGVGNTGDYYVVSVAGTTLLDGHADWLIGDLVIFQNNKWDKVPGHNSEVISVNNVAPVSGNVQLVPSDIGAVSTADLTTLAEANKVPQLTSSGFISTSQISAATTSQIGGIVVGDNLTVDGNGRLSAQNSYVLPAATATTLGGVMVGSNINLTTTGMISLSAATTSSLGLLQVGNNIALTSTGIISLSAATASQLGLLKVGSNINLNTEGLISLSPTTTSQLGVMSPGAGLSADAYGVVSVTALPAGVTVDGGTY